MTSHQVDGYIVACNQSFNLKDISDTFSPFFLERSARVCVAERAQTGEVRPTSLGSQAFLSLVAAATLQLCIIWEPICQSSSALQRRHVCSDAQVRQLARTPHTRAKTASLKKKKEKKDETSQLYKGMMRGHFFEIKKTGIQQLRTLGKQFLSSTRILNGPQLVKFQCVIFDFI